VHTKFWMDLHHIHIITTEQYSNTVITSCGIVVGIVIIIYCQ
jgi:hypothetical protein